MLTVGSLFSGIGGLELGLERTGGFKVVWQSEVDAYASAVLKKHWPQVPNLGDITKINWSEVEKPDVICGGFPCQDISIAGKGVGLEKGKRSGLWKEFAKAIRVLRPKYALIENVPMLVHRGLSIVLCDLAEAGYDAEWFTLCAKDVGAPHKRERIFIIAHTNQQRCGQRRSNGGERILDYGKRETSQSFPQRSERLGRTDADFENNASYCGGERVSWFGEVKVREFSEFSGFKNVRRVEDLFVRPELPSPLFHGNRDGVPNWLERIKCLGNAVVPACAQVVGEALYAIEKDEGKTK